MWRCKGICKTGLKNSFILRHQSRWEKFNDSFVFFFSVRVNHFWKLGTEIKFDSPLLCGRWSPHIQFSNVKFSFRGFFLFVFEKFSEKFASNYFRASSSFISILVFKLMSCTSIYLMCASWWLYRDIGVVADCRDQTTNDLLSSCFLVVITTTTDCRGGWRKQSKMNNNHHPTPNRKEKKK